MAQSLFEHGQITTTLVKAKDLRPWAEKLITLAGKAHKGSLAARQRLMALMGDRAIIPEEFREEYEDMPDAARLRVLRSRSGRRHRMGEPKGGMRFTALSVVHHLINNIAPRYADRPGGYTRVIRLGEPNKGNNAEMAVLQLVGEEESPGTVTRPERTARQRRTERRYAAAAKAAKKQADVAKESSSGQATATAEEPPPESAAQGEQGGSEENQE
jgi:large subunit ribosomal protein L17